MTGGSSMPGFLSTSMPLTNLAGPIMELGNRLDAARLKQNVPLASYTTFRIGGPADLFYDAISADDLANAVAAARRSGMPYFILGLGANILDRRPRISRPRDTKRRSPHPICRGRPRVVREWRDHARPHRGVRTTRLVGIGTLRRNSEHRRWRSVAESPFPLARPRPRADHVHRGGVRVRASSSTRGRSELRRPRVHAIWLRHQRSPSPAARSRCRSRFGSRRRRRRRCIASCRRT